MLLNDIYLPYKQQKSEVRKDEMDSDSKRNLDDFVCNKVGVGVKNIKVNTERGEKSNE